jgi:hypothetical protein
VAKVEAVLVLGEAAEWVAAWASDAAAAWVNISLSMGSVLV